MLHITQLRPSKSRLNNSWTSEDEREHPFSSTEWWNVEAFFKTENKKLWSLRAYLSQWCSKSHESGSLLNMTLFNQETGKHFACHSRNEMTKLESTKQGFNIRYNESFIKGTYPNYTMKFIDKKHDIELKIDYHVESIPHWVAEEATNGWIPMGFGFFRYGFIPKGIISGTMKLGNKNLPIKGRGYFEHVWGNFSYSNPLSNLFELKKTIPMYTKFFGWWIHNHNIRIPKNIMFNTNNNPFGYDWFWALLDNGWTLFYGNLLFWVTEGPALGTLILSKDGKTYIEFCNIQFRYNETAYSKNYDFYYPSELELTAFKGKEKLHMRLKMKAESREYVSRFSHGKYWLALVSCEAPGTIDGYYFDGSKKEKLSGMCKIEPQRQISVLGHNSLRLDFISPPKGVGINAILNSHYLKKRITIKIHLAPHLSLRFQVKRLSGIR